MSPVDSRLPRYAPGLRGFLGATFVLGVVGTAAVIAQAALIARLVAAVFRGGEGLAQQRETLVLLAGVVIVRAAVAWTQETTAARTAGRVRARLRSLLLRRSFDLGPAWIGERSSMLSRLATHGIDAIDPYVATYLPQLVLAVVAPVLVVVQIGMTDPLSAVIIVVTLPLIPLFGALVGWSTDQRLARQVEALQRLSHHFLDVLDGLPVLRAYRRGHAQRNTIAAATNEYRLATMSVLRLSFLSSFVLELTATLSVAVVAVAIGLRLDNDHLGFQSALFVLILVPEAYLPLRALGASFHTAAEGRAATIEVLDVLEASPSDTTATSPSPPAEPSAEEHAGLRVDNIAVTYVDRPHPAVTEVTLAVGPGELVALVAPSGTGKSTVIAAILGIVAIDAGTVTFDGRRLADTDRSAWWRRIAWVPQRPALVAGTVADNITLGNAADDDSVLAVLNAAGGAELDPERVLGEGGSGLSAGQKQRVAVARALLRCTGGADLLLLDEPTEHLDRDNEATVLRAITALAHDPVTPRCVLMATHRPEAIAVADRVVRLDANPRDERADDHAASVG